MEERIIRAVLAVRAHRRIIRAVLASDKRAPACRAHNHDGLLGQLDASNSSVPAVLLLLVQVPVSKHRKKKGCPPFFFLLYPLWTRKRCTTFGTQNLLERFGTDFDDLDHTFLL